MGWAMPDTLAGQIKVLSGWAFPSDRFNELEGLPLIRIRDLGRGTTEVKFKGSFDPRYVVDEGDVLIGMDGDFSVEKWSGGAALLNQRVCKVGSASEHLDQGFLYWYLMPHVAEIHRKTPQTTVRHLSASSLGEILAPPILVSEQRAVSQILDTLDTTIRQTEAIIEKLKQVKQGLLHDLLTRGIDANGELRPPQSQAPHLYKDSPLGRIPREWKLLPIEWLASEVTSGARDWARYYAESGTTFVRIGNLTREHINFRFESLAFVNPPKAGEAQRTRLQEGDILISITADLGIIGVVPATLGEAHISQHIAMVRIDSERANPRFVGHFLAGHAAQRHIASLNDSGAKAGLNLPTIRGLHVVVPPQSEQEAIAGQLDVIDLRIAAAKIELSKMSMFKSGLMDDLLTGRVRVTPLLNATP